METPDEGYVADLGAALEAVGTAAVTVAADLPLLAREPVDRASAVATESGNAADSVTVQIPARLKRQLGVSADEYEPGVVVARSLTKIYGLPDIRVGFAVATSDRLADLETARRPWNLSTPAAAVGTHWLHDEAVVDETRKQVRRERDRLFSALSTGFDVFESKGPFLLFDVGQGSVDDLLASARERGGVLRDARSVRGLDNHVRVAVKEREWGLWGRILGTRLQDRAKQHALSRLRRGDGGDRLILQSAMVS